MFNNSATEDPARTLTGLRGLITCAEELRCFSRKTTTGDNTHMKNNLDNYIEIGLRSQKEARLLLLVCSSFKHRKGEELKIVLRGSMIILRAALSSKMAACMGSKGHLTMDVKGITVT